MMNVLPLRDERPHERSAQCWCGPRVEWLDPDTNLPWPGNGPLIVHHSADCREVSEMVTGESVAPGLEWELVED